MSSLKKYLAKKFEGIHQYVGSLPIISLKPKGEAENVLLFVGSEHGDKPQGTKALLSLAEKLRDEPLSKTQIDIIPVLDTKGYPAKRTSYGDGGLGLPLSLDKAYGLPENERPQQLKNLFTILNERYDLGLMFTTSYADEAPLVNGYFVVVQAESVEEKGKEVISFGSPILKDISGSILNKLKNEGVSLLDKSEKGFLGGHYLLVKEGVVAEGEIEKTKLGKVVKKVEVKSGFLRSCRARGIPALILSALATSIDDLKSVEAHEKALEATIRMYEGKKFKL